MKKLLIFSMMLCFGFIAMGQKQQTDAKTLEVNFTPLGDSPVSINGIKFRKFTSDYSAIRLEVSMTSNTDRTVSRQDGQLQIPFGETLVDNPLTNSSDGSFSLNIRPGIEKHFDGTNRLSPYVGGVLDIGFSSSTQKNEHWGPETLGNTGAETNANNYAEWEQKTKTGSIMFGLGAVAGMDFYFADNLYLGAEFGFGFGFTSMNPTKYTSDNDEAWAISALSELDPTIGSLYPVSTNFEGGEIDIDMNGEISSVTVRDDEKGGSNLNFGTRAQGALRLGFIF